MWASATWLEYESSLAARARGRGMQKMNLAVGVVMFALAVGIHLWLSKRQFQRTNASGVEQYGSFLSSVGENVLRWIGGMSILALCLGGGYFIFIA